MSRCLAWARRLGLGLAWLVMGMGLAWAAESGTRVVALGSQPSYALSPAFDVLDDPSGVLTLDQVRGPEWARRFVPVPGTLSGTNFGLTRSAIWLRVTLAPAPDAPADWLLEVAYPPLDRLALWTPGADGSYRVQEAGDLRPFAQRVVAHRNHVLPVRLVPGQPTTIYLRAEGQGTVSVPTRLWQPAALWRSDQGGYATLALYFGLLTGLFLYNLLLWISVRDRGYLIYVAFVAGMAVAQAALTGFGYQFLWSEATWWNSVAPPAGMSIAAIFGMLFARDFLASAARMPMLDRVLQLLIGGWLLTLLAALAAPYGWSTWMVTVLAVVSVATLIVAGALCVRRGYPGARYFLTAWALLLGGVLTLFLHNIGVLPSNPFTSNGLLIGSAGEMILLSFALADRIDISRRFKEQAQVRLAAEHAMVETLRQSQERLKQVLQEREIILESSSVGIVFLTDKGRLRWANKAMLDIFATGGRPITSMEPFYLSREQYLRVGAEVAQCAREGRVFEQELPVRQSNGTHIWILLSGKAVARHDLSQGTVWVITDITRRKQLEEELRATQAEREAEMQSALEQQRALNELRTRFVAMTSHEFRTPLAAILSAQELLRHYGDRLPQPERVELLDGIAGGVQRMSRMIERVLLLGQADAHMLECAPQPLDLAVLCASVAQEARLQQPEAGSEIELSIDPALAQGRYDEKLLRHILGNLLTNALKYSPGGRPVRLDVRREGDEVVFEVADQGIGIPEDELPHLFESFHRASNVGAIAGTGLGLAIVRHAVQAHGGTIAVDSRLGEGTRFVVRLPQAMAPAPAPAPAVA